MTASTIINLVDALSPNYYSNSQKLGWLATIDGKIYEEVLMTHEDAPEDEFDPSDYAPTGQGNIPSLTLLVDDPYAEDLYSFYLLSRIAAANSEISKYDQFATMFNTAYTEWTNYYNKKHMPVKKGRWIL